MDACYDRGGMFQVRRFVTDGAVLLNFYPLSFDTLFGADLGHGMVHRVVHLVFSSSFLGGVQSSSTIVRKTPQKVFSSTPL